MQTSNKKLKKYAGLLNDAAPKGEFLAYINKEEAQLLKNNGGLGLLTNFGVPSYRGAGGYQGGSGSSSSGSSSGSSSSGGGSSSGGSGGGGGGGGRDASSSDFGGSSSSSSNSSSSNVSGGNGRTDAQSQYGDSSYDSSQNVSNREQSFGNNNSSNFDYETEAYSNVGEITDATYNPKTKSVDIEQTPGVVNTEQYQTSSLGAYLDSPDVSEKEKIDTLDRIQALQNSNIVGSKLSNLETDFVLGNLTKSLDNIKSDSKYNDLTSKIDVEGTTWGKDFQDAPIETFLKSGGVLGSIIRSGYDQYKNNKVLELLGYTGATIKYNPDGSGDFNYTGYPTVNVGRDEINNLAPMAPYAVQGTTPLPSVAQKYFDELPQGSGLSFQAAYDAAKTKVNQTLGNPSAMGLLAVNESPFYDFLKIRGLDRRIL